MYENGIINIKKQDDERDRWRSNYWYEDEFEHDYDTHQFPHPRNKYFSTIPSEPVSKHQTHPKPRVNDPVILLGSQLKQLELLGKRINLLHSTSLKFLGHLILCQKDTMKGCLGSMQMQSNQLKNTWMLFGIIWKHIMLRMKMSIFNP